MKAITIQPHIYRIIAWLMTVAAVFLFEASWLR